MPSINGWFYWIIERIYHLPEPPVRKRTKPLEVICVGMPRTGTESLQHALEILGYDPTYHGWTIIFETPNYAEQWVRLCRRKWFPPVGGDIDITVKDFDNIMGHATAVADAPASVFAQELIQAYPEAKIVLNTRGDIDTWHQSVMNTLGTAPKQWGLFVLSWLNRECFWAWHVYERFMWPGLFRALDGTVATGMLRCGKWVYRSDAEEAHNAMIRGMVPKERLLEWKVEDGWEPLCDFLGKPVPDEPFPHKGATTRFDDVLKKLGERWVMGAVQNVAVMTAIGVGVWAAAHHYRR